MAEMVKNTRDKKIVENYCNGSNELKYKGVRKRKWGKWVSEIRLPNSRERIWLGSYDSAEKAARAFDAAMFCLRGELANFNFPDNPPEIPGGRTMSRNEIQAAAAKFANSGRTGEIDQSSAEQSGSDSRLESPSRLLVSDEITVQLDETELKMDYSFLDLLVNTNMGSGDFGFPGFDDIFATTETPSLDIEEENPNVVLAQDSFLWNF